MVIIVINDESHEIRKVVARVMNVVRTRVLQGALAETRFSYEQKILVIKERPLDPSFGVGERGRPVQPHKNRRQLATLEEMPLDACALRLHKHLRLRRKMEYPRLPRHRP